MSAVFLFCFVQAQNVILYNDDDIRHLDWELSCWHKEGVIDADKVHEQIIDMSIEATWSGCSVNETNSAGPGSYNMPLAAPTPGGTDSTGVAAPTGDPVAVASNGNGGSAATSSLAPAINLTCQGERRYDAPSKVSITAV
jgi:subtilisin family serine protease